MHPQPANCKQHYDAALKKGMPDHAILLLVSVQHQRLTLIQKSRPQKHYTISTSHLGTGQREGSNQTPSGLHEIVERYGHNAPLGTVFKSRQPTGEVLPEADWHGSRPEDLILTRILRLAGREPGHNAGPGIDSFDRYIYIHGTNHEERLGRPSSGGCIRMKNSDIAQLFTATDNHPLWCWID